MKTIKPIDLYKASGCSPSALPADLLKLLDKRLYGMDGLDLLKRIPDASIKLVVFDPQYQNLNDKMKYGNKAGTGRMKGMRGLPVQDAMNVWEFGQEITRILTPSGHVTLWIDKLMFCATDPLLDIFSRRDGTTDMNRVDLIVWDKMKMLMGYRSRRCSEYLVVFQKNPLRAKGCWTDHEIRDVWQEKVVKDHPHSKPIALQSRLITALTKPGDVVCDFTAGGFSVMTAAHNVGRRFLGCEFLLEGDPALRP